MPKGRGDFYVPDGRYSLESFHRCLVENRHHLFLPAKKRKWIKIHGVRTYAKEWEKNLKQYVRRNLGNVWHITLPLSREGAQRYTVDFYVCNYTPELLMFYTASTNWEYEKTLLKFIRTTSGLGQMWIGPKKFEGLIFHFMDIFDPTVERFFARRSNRDTFPAKIRPRTSRRIDWGAEDSFDTLSELRELYGVRPTSVIMRLRKGKIQLTNDGMFVLTRVDQEMFDAFEEAMGYIRDEEAHITKVSQRMNLVIDKLPLREGELVVPTLTSGCIHLKGMKLETATAQKIMRGLDKFDFIDVSTSEGSFSWTATAIDKEKGSIFGVNSDEETIYLVPRFNTTFESFLDFYRQILEEVDQTATFERFGAPSGR